MSPRSPSALAAAARLGETRIPTCTRSQPVFATCSPGLESFSLYFIFLQAATFLILHSEGQWGANASAVPPSPPPCPKRSLSDGTLVGFRLAAEPPNRKSFGRINRNLALISFPEQGRQKPNVPPPFPPLSLTANTRAQPGSYQLASGYSLRNQKSFSLFRRSEEAEAHEE